MPVPTQRRTHETDSLPEVASARWDPIAELERQFSRVWRPFLPVVDTMFVPMSDIEETDDSYVVELDLPGAKKENVEISLASRRLSVTGHVKPKDRTGVVRRQSRSEGEFYFEVSFPGDVDEKAVRASLADGVLSIRVPKSHEERPRRIQVS